MGENDQSIAKVKVALAQASKTSPDDWFPVFRARAGMQVVFEQIRKLNEPGSVVTQAYTCATAVNPILAADLRPHYADIAAETISIDPTLVTVPSDFRALVVQNTFGIVDEASAAALKQIAHASKGMLIEDSAHCVTSMARDHDSRSPLADVSVHSFGIEKLLSTRFGGAIWLNPDMKDQQLRQAMARQLQTLPTPGFKTALAARAYLNETRVFNRLPGKLARALKSITEKAGVFLPAISDRERVGKMDQAPMKPSQWVANHMLEGLGSLQDAQETRRHACRIYLEELDGVVDIPASITPHMSLARFPIFLTKSQVAAGYDAEALLAALTKAGFYAGRWYRPALFPGVKNPTVYGLDADLEDLPETKRLIASAVNLPTLESPDRVRTICQEVRRYFA